MTDFDLTRREFIQVGTAPMAVFIGGSQFQIDHDTIRNEYEFQGVADLLGTESARPDPADEFFENKLYFAYRYTATDTGSMWSITQADVPNGSWTLLPVKAEEANFSSLNVDDLDILNSLKLAKHDPANLPPEDEEAQLNYDTKRGAIVWYNGDHIERPSWVHSHDVRTAANTVENTTDEQIIDRKAGVVERFLEQRVFVNRASGTYDTASSNDDFTYRVYIGGDGFDPTAGEGAEIASITTVQENVTNGPWQIKTTITVRSEGASGTIVAHSEGAFNNSINNDHHGPVTVDTTTAADLVATVQWNNAKAGNVASIEQSYLQVMA